MRAGAGTSAPYRRQVSGLPEAQEVSSIGRCPAPLAIPAIINASKVNTLLQHGELALIIGLIGGVIGIASTAASGSF
jgi:hypothetical protein